jgi:hypothetical protein
MYTAKNANEYNIKLNKNQMNAIYSISYNKEKQNRLMSILQYCIKYTDATTGFLTKTIGRLFSMYSVNDFEYHSKISRKYFYTLVNLLIDHKLICVHKIVHKTVHKSNTPESIENTNIEPVFEKTNNITPNLNTNTHTLNTTNVVNVIDLTEEVFKELKVKSKIIKSMVMAKLQNTVLDAAGAIKYIVKVITEKTEQYNSMRVEYAKAVANTKYSKSKNTFVAPTKKPRNFSNFEPRSICSDEESMKEIEDKLTAPKENNEVDIQRLLNQYKS